MYYIISICILYIPSPNFVEANHPNLLVNPTFNPIFFSEKVTLMFSIYASVSKNP